MACYVHLIINNTLIAAVIVFAGVAFSLPGNSQSVPPDPQHELLRLSATEYGKIARECDYSDILKYRRCVWSELKRLGVYPSGSVE